MHAHQPRVASCQLHVQAPACEIRPVSACVLARRADSGELMTLLQSATDVKFEIKAKLWKLFKLYASNNQCAGRSQVRTLRSKVKGSKHGACTA